MEWKQVPGWTMYEVSEFGDVRNVHTGKILSQTVRKRDHRPAVTILPGTRWGYVGLSKRWEATVQQLVCRAFHGDKPTPRHQVAHNDGNRSNNHYKNLRWATSQEDAHDRALHGHWSKSMLKRNTSRGEDRPASKLTNVEVAEIYVSNSRNVDLAAKYGVTPPIIFKIKHKKAWTHITRNIKKP